MTRRTPDPRTLLMWTSEPHPEWHDPDHPSNRHNAVTANLEVRRPPKDTCPPTRETR